MLTFVEILRCLWIDQFSDNLTVPCLIELVDHDAMEACQFLHQSDDDLKESIQLCCGG